MKQSIFQASEAVIKTADRQARKHHLNTLDILERSFVSAMLGLNVTPEEFALVINLVLENYKKEFKRIEGIKR